MRKYLILSLILLTGCIGSDEVDDPIVGESIVLDQKQLPILLGDTKAAEATFFNRYGIEEEAQLIWTSSDESVATVDISGQVTAQGVGQANLTCSVGSTTGLPLPVTVVESEDDVAQVCVTSSAGNQMGVGQEIQLMVEVLNINDESIAGLESDFTSLDPEIIAVDENGLATGLANGYGRITATVDGVQSSIFGIQVGQTSRTGTFTGTNGYDAEGSTELFLADNGDLMLRLEDNFDTDFALGTFIYLSNSTSGSVTRNEGVEIQEVSTGGAHLFNVSDIDPTISIDQFDYVIVLCKPATITFGYAQLN